MTVSQMPGYSSWTADGTSARRAAGLADEHAELLMQGAIRAEALLAVAAGGCWPAPVAGSPSAIVSPAVTGRAAAALDWDCS